MKTANTTRTTFIRWLKFNFVGGIGILLQLGLLALFSKMLHMPYLLATAAAVEMTVLHNFVWHERYTWKDLTPAVGAANGGRYTPASGRDSYRAILLRLVRFHLSNGAVSIVGNLLLMKLFAGELHMPVLVANINAITICSLVNFCLANQWVFALEDQCKRNYPTQATKA